VTLIEQWVASARSAPVTDGAWAAVDHRYKELTRSARDIEVGRRSQSPRCGERCKRREYWLRQ
jgi:hypothetical protein